MLLPPTLDSCSSLASIMNFVEEYKKYSERKGNIPMESLLDGVVFERVLDLGQQNR